MEKTFISACRTNDQPLIKSFLDTGEADIHFQDDIGNTALHYLCTNNDPSSAEKLIQAGGDIGSGNFSGETPLHLAAASGSVPLIRLLEAKGADINAQNREGLTPLIFAIRNNRTEAARYLIEAGADKYIRTAHALSAEDYARAEAMDELLLFFDQSPLKNDTRGNSPLHYAVHQNGVSTVRNILVKDKSTINSRNSQGMTPLLIAISRLNFDISDMLLSFGADPNLNNIEDQNTPLHIAAINGTAWLGEILLEHGASVNALNRDGATPLILAVQGQHRDFVSLLIQKGADIAVSDNLERTALSYAREWGIQELIKLLDQPKSRNNGKENQKK